MLYEIVMNEVYRGRDKKEERRRKGDEREDGRRREGCRKAISLPTIRQPQESIFMFIK
jgi:hypothetical protein